MKGLVFTLLLAVFSTSVAQASFYCPPEVPDPVADWMYAKGYKSPSIGDMQTYLRYRGYSSPSLTDAYDLMRKEGFYYGRKVVPYAVDRWMRSKGYQSPSAGDMQIYLRHLGYNSPSLGDAFRQMRSEGFCHY